MITQNEFESNTLKTSVSQNILNPSGITNIKRNLINTKYQEISRIGGILEISPRRLNSYFLIVKFKKLQQKIAVPGNS